MTGSSCGNGLITKIVWLQHGPRGPEWRREGWYLFGFPLYIRDMGPRFRVYREVKSRGPYGPHPDDLAERDSMA